MNKTIGNNWKDHLYLDALGSSLVIAASVLIFLFVAVAAIAEVMPAGAPVADACPTTRFAEADDNNQRPGAPRLPARTACA